ncbi:hypothetical protein FJ251_07580 [bacterium]|nr:hypothetical protein [bacterium]
MKAIAFTRSMLVTLMLLGIACSDDDKPMAPNDESAVGSVSGVVTEAQGYALEGVTVTLGGRTAPTNEDGWFVFTDVPAAANAVLGLAMEGYFSAYRRVDILAGDTTHLPSVELLPVAEQNIDAAAGGSASTADGDGTASFPANALVTAAGAPYAGTASVQLAAALPEDDYFYNAFPGDFEGEAAGGGTVPFVSYGFMGVALRGAAGEALFLANGAQAELSLRMPSGALRFAQATIPMWYFDQERGVWVEEGEATLVGDTYVGQVQQVGIWNWDLPTTDICQVTGQVQNDAGQPVVGARVYSQGIDCAFADQVYSGADGSFSVRAIKECSAALQAIRGSIASQSETLAVGSENTQALPNPLVLDSPAFSITLSWGAEPEDLDSHLLIPMTWNPTYDFYHICYFSEGSLAADPYTNLNTDATDGFGPEIVSGTKLYPGTYSYYVHHYGGLTTIAASPTRVTLQASGIYRTWNANTASGTFHDGGGYDDEGSYYEDYWHVFDLVVSAQGELSVVSRNRVVVDSGEGPWWTAGVTIFEESLRSAGKQR